MTPSMCPVGEILLLLFILNKAFLLFLCLFHCLFHCLFQILIVEVDLGCSCCHLGSLAADRLRDNEPRYNESLAIRKSASQPCW